MLPKIDKAGLVSPFIILVIILVFIGILILGQILYTNFYTPFKIKQQTEQAQKNKQQSRDDYFKLIEEQENRTKKTIDTSFERDKARGQKQVVFVLVKPKTVNESAISPLISMLKTSLNQTPSDNLSLEYINSFYADQAKNFEVSDFDLSIRIDGIYTANDITKVGDMNYFWSKDPFGVIKLEDAFDKILKDNNIQIAQEDKIVFLYFDDSFDLASENPEQRFYEHKKFRSFANDISGRAYINVYNFNPSFSKTLVEIAAHEILHLFGASDKYEENLASKRVCSELGRGDPDKTPILPQQTADIMCGYIEKEDEKFERGKLLDETIVINKHTAKEIGWID